MIHRLLSLLIVTSAAQGAEPPPPPPAAVPQKPSTAAPQAKPNLAPAVQKAEKAKEDAALREEEFAIQGEFVGKMRDADFAFQVIALDKGVFDAVLCPGGLPGEGWTKQPAIRQRVSGKREGAGTVVRFSGNGWTGVLKDDDIQLTDFKGTNIGSLKRVHRTSPTQGMAPPAGAVVLFDGKGLGAFKKGARITPDGLLMQGCTSLQEFGDCTLHLEFQLSFMPEQRGQGRSNSGVYLEGRYEVQVLDSFGLNGENNECGGIYTIAKPQVNMCYPPQTWQTYDLEFQAPDFDAAGKKTEDAHITVKHNGVLIHDGVAIPHPTSAAPFPTEATKGPLYLQDHGNQVRYRNIWVMPK